jgi:transglutaminase-like putative cysteine protease
MICAMKPSKITIFAVTMCLAVLLIVNCTARYFRSAEAAPPAVHHRLADWPFSQYWTGIVFNGAKIGFTHFELRPAPDASNLFDVRSTAYFKFRLLMYDKSIHLQARDRIAGDLTLQAFDYDYNLDGNRLQLKGKRYSDHLEVSWISRDRREVTNLPISGPLYPVGCILMVPVAKGLEVGKQYRYQVFDGETRSLQTVEQTVVSYEESDLFEGRAFKIKTRLQNQQVTTWLDHSGRPLLEMSMGGVIISNLESQFVAERYLTRAAVNKEEVIIDFSLIRSNRELLHPEAISELTVNIAAGDTDLQIPSDSRQSCRKGAAKTTCRIRRQYGPDLLSGRDPSAAAAKRYLLPSNSIPVKHPDIKGLAANITSENNTTEENIRKLIQWLKDNIDQEPIDVFSALDVLERKKAECQGHALLYTALARSAGIPSRVVNGIVYATDFNGFLYHAWVESLVNGQWVAVDPTLHQYPADVTHLKFVTGENPSDLLPLIGLIGKLKIEIEQADP